MVAQQIKRAPFLRLKPPRPGGFGPPSRCALVSQQEAIALLSSWGVEHTTSDRYEQAWQADFAKFQADEKQANKALQRKFKPPLDRLKEAFPKLARFLKRHLDQIETLADAATPEEIVQLETALGVPLPESYRTFLACTAELVYGGGLQIGLPHTFMHPSDDTLPSSGMLCLGDFWWEGDGDQILVGKVEPGSEPPLLYYNHATPAISQLAKSFAAWTESLPRMLAEI